MHTTRLSSKGQVILPKAVRDAHRWGPGTQFAVETAGETVVLKPIRARAHSRLEDVVGCLKVNGPARRIEEMDDAVTAELRERRDRGRY